MKLSEQPSEDFVAWINLVTPEEMKARGIKGNYSYGFTGAMSRLLVSHPRIGSAFNQLFSQIMFAPGVLSRQEREMIAGVTAAAQGCHY